MVWNEIHHKTESNSNHSGHGYPDPHYLDRVLGELAAQGVTEDDDEDDEDMESSEEEEEVPRYPPSGTGTYSPQTFKHLCGTSTQSHPLGTGAHRPEVTLSSDSDSL